MENPVESSPLLERKDGLLSKRIWEEMKTITRISLPSMVFRVTSYGVFIVTQSFIGHISSIDLAAYSIVQAISMRFINGLVLGMSSATETLCGQGFGAKQYHMLGIYLQRSWIVNLVVTTITLPIFIFATPIYELLGEEDDISEAAGTISLWFIPVIYTFVFTMTIQMFLQAQMKNNIIAYISSLMFLLHLLVSWIFVYKLDLGIPGAMSGIIISQWGLVFREWVYVYGGWCKETWKGFSMLAFSDLVPIIKLSISSGFMLALELWYTSVLVLIAGYSDDAVVEISAFSICLNLFAIEFMIAVGFLTGACVRVSNELGRGDVEAARFSMKVVVCMSTALGLFFCILCIAFGHSIPYLFTSDVAVAEAAGDLSVLLALTMLVGTIQAAFTGVAVGVGAQGKVAIVNVVSYYIIGVSLGCVLAYVANIGIKGIWIGMLVGMVVQLIILVIIVLRINWNEEVNKTEKRLERFLHESPQDGSNKSSNGLLE